MLSQDTKNLAQSIKDLQHKAEQIAQVLNCIAINMQSLADSLTLLERNKVIHQPCERREYEDFDEIA